MILVDTSVWVDHLLLGEPELSRILREDQVITHPLVIEELACGNLKRRTEIIGLLEALPKAPLASHGEFLDFLATHDLHGTGVGAVDVHLLASAHLARACLWSKDKALHRAAKRLGILKPA